jgi:hypothetical protein
LLEESCIRELKLLDTIPYPMDKPRIGKFDYISVPPSLPRPLTESTRKLPFHLSLSEAAALPMLWKRKSGGVRWLIRLFGKPWGEVCREPA